MTSAQLAPEEYLRHLRTESARFREVLESCDPEAVVPGCPDWSAADLLWHLTGVQGFWGRLVAQRPITPDELPEPVRPATYVELLAAFDEASAMLIEALTSAAPEDEAWTWSDDHTVGFIQRRQAHEALIHRLDAEQAAGTVTALDPELASDGVDEVLTVMYAGCPPWGTQTPGELHLRVDCADTDRQLWVNLARFTGTDPDDGVSHDEADLMVVPDPGVEPDAVIEGTAATLNAWLWHRTGADELSTAGSQEVLDRFTTVLSQPLN